MPQQIRIDDWSEISLGIRGRGASDGLSRSRQTRATLVLICFFSRLDKHSFRIRGDESVGNVQAK